MLGDDGLGYNELVAAPLCKVSAHAEIRLEGGELAWIAPGHAALVAIFHPVDEISAIALVPATRSVKPCSWTLGWMPGTPVGSSAPSCSSAS